ncbi:MAG: APC family permease [Parachlamydiaceae bacterium]
MKKSQEKNELGFRSMILLGINAVIGSGIFLLPGTVSHLTGSWSIFVYLFVMVIVMSIGWCFAQCATLFNRNGGAYVYAKAAFGDFIGFEIGIMRWVIGIMAWASLIVGFITALSCLWPTVLDEPYRTVLIFTILGGLSFLNIVGVQIFKYINNIVSLAKILPLLIFVFFGLFSMKMTNFPSLNIQGLNKEAFGGAALVIFYAFGGFETLTVAAGEMKNPKKNLPIAVMLVITFCSILYFVIQFISMGILGDQLSESKTPLADVAQRIMGEEGKLFVTLAMLISIGGINLTASFITPRSCVALAEDGMIPKQLAYTGRFGTPTLSILLTAGTAGILAFCGSFSQLAVITVISRFVQYISTCLAVIVLHKKMNPSKSLFQEWRFILIPSIALLGIGWLILQATPLQLLGGLSALVIGIPFYFIQRSFRRIPRLSYPLSIEKSEVLL